MYVYLHQGEDTLIHFYKKLNYIFVGYRRETRVRIRSGDQFNFFPFQKIIK